MESYIYDRTRDGVFYLDLAKTWEKTMVAARIIAAIQEKNKKDVLVSAKGFVFHQFTAAGYYLRRAFALTTLPIIIRRVC